jgi:hypothetical protein
VRAELEANRALVAAARDYHRAVADTFRAVQQRGGTVAPQHFPQGLVAPGRVVSTAWDAARSTGIVRDMPHDLVLAIGRVYERQEEYGVLARTIGAIAYDELIRRGIHGLVAGFGNYIFIQDEFAEREARLLEAYASALERLDAGG